MDNEHDMQYLGMESSKGFINRNITWNEGGNVDRNQQYAQQVESDYNSIAKNSFKIDFRNDHEHFSGDINKCSDNAPQPPLQPSPNIVDQVAFTKSRSTCR